MNKIATESCQPPFTGFAFGLVLITSFAWIAMLFPLWVLLVST